MCFPLSPPGLQGGDLIPFTAENLRLRCKIRQDPPIQAVRPGGELESGLLTEVLIFSPRGLNQILSKGPTVRDTQQLLSGRPVVHSPARLWAFATGRALFWGLGTSLSRTGEVPAPPPVGSHLVEKRGRAARAPADLATR